MSRRIVTIALGLLPLLAGCAALLRAPPPELDATLRLSAGLEALDEGRHSQAYEELAWVATSCAGRAAGLEARVALAALELDPRNPVGRPEVGTELLGQIILGTRTPEWIRPIAESTYLLALALGAPEPEEAEPIDAEAEVERPLPIPPPADDRTPEDQEQREPPASPPPVEPVPAEGVHGCGSVLEETDTPTLVLPLLPGPSLVEILAEAEAGRAQAEERIQALEAELERIRLELAQTRGELERIRRTLQP